MTKHYCRLKAAVVFGEITRWKIPVRAGGKLKMLETLAHPDCRNQIANTIGY